MSGRRSWAVVKDSLTTQARSRRVATVKECLTVQFDGNREVQRPVTLYNLDATRHLEA